MKFFILILEIFLSVQLIHSFQLRYQRCFDTNRHIITKCKMCEAGRNVEVEENSGYEIPDDEQLVEMEEETDILDDSLLSKDLLNATVINDAVKVLSPLELKIQAKEAELRKVLSNLENEVAFQRRSLSTAKDKVSESGKTGFFIVQAQVAEFLVRIL